MNGIFVAFSKVINRQAPNKREIDFLTVYTEAERTLTTFQCSASGVMIKH